MITELGFPSYHYNEISLSTLFRAERSCLP